MRIISWNVNGRVRDIPAQLDYLEPLNPNVLVLQEITLKSAAQIRPFLVKQGLTNILDTTSANMSGPRRYGLMIASRSPITALSPVSKPCWPERILAASVSATTTCPAFTVITTHTPPGSTNGQIKVTMLESVYEEASLNPGPVVLAGDFNAPQLELPDGLVTWAQSKRKDGSWGLIKSRGARWDLADRKLFEGALKDAFRSLNGQVDAHSWVLRQKDKRIPRRFDHILLSPHWRVHRCEYLYEALDQKLSDHAPIMAELEIT